ncbi:unnamed protein product [Peronospora belbahrii]|uniref:Protein kinase domain-containing protein n=1 Tax=Peronospora belbahrii TaxID=622444 RepID=A0AAU9L102_9STRA|nr:unnamed protein product [Peronospora belbahrii]
MTKVRGVCGSPLSSVDEAEDTGRRSFSFPESTSSPALKRTRRKRKVKKSILPTTKKLKSESSALFETKSIHKLVQDAPRDLVTYLNDQMSVIHQEKLEKEYGRGQGYIVTLPLPSSKKKRKEYENWIKELGFTSGTALKQNALRISSLKADVIINELKRRMSSMAEKWDIEKAEEVEDSNVVKELMSKGDTLLNNEQEEEEKSTGDDATDMAMMIRLKQYYQKLESQKLEVVSFEENHRLLSSTQHTAIADAMEDVLAQPSTRRDRRLARRLSKLGRISDRRLSSIALAPSSSSFLPLVEDDWLWDRKMETRARTPIKRHVSLGDNGVAEKTKVEGERVLYLVLDSGLIDVKVFKEVLRKSIRLAYRGLLQESKRLLDGVYVLLPPARSLSCECAIEAAGNQSVVCQEVAHSVLLSHATEQGMCPNFLRIYDVFLAYEQPRSDLWGSKTNRKPAELLTETNHNPGAFICQEDPLVSSSDECNRLFQYIRMEFCDGGDLEDFIGLQRNKTLPLATVSVPFFFQMVYSLYCAREKFNLRHCDIKLLNFFLKDIGRADLRKDPGSNIVLHYLLEDVCFVFQMPASFSYWVKLADFGAADSNPENLGSPVTIDQFTTLENTPVEFLLEGDAAKQSYAADTFCLGLCVLHLFTGCAPYEEIFGTRDLPCRTSEGPQVHLDEPTEEFRIFCD